MRNLVLKIGIGLVALFGFGVFTGVVVGRQTHWTGRWAANDKTFEQQWIDARINEYTPLLGLTSEQTTVIRTHLDELAVDLQGLRAELRTKITEAFKKTNVTIANELKPEQREKFWKLLKEKSEKRQRNCVKQNTPPD